MIGLFRFALCVLASPRFARALADHISLVLGSMNAI